MTALVDRKTKCVVEFSETVRECGKSREIVAELTPYSIRVKLKGTRQWYVIAPSEMWYLGAKHAAEAKKAEKLAEKKAKRR